LVWKSFDENNQVWFKDEFLLLDLKLNKPENDISNKLLEILLVAQELNPSFLIGDNGFYVTTKLTFNKSFGLGTSSTLIANIAKWANVNPYQLLWKSFKGSGYDLACATSLSGLVYSIVNEFPVVNAVAFTPLFKEQVYFVYLNTKQDSKEGILQYKKLSRKSKENAIIEINKLTTLILKCSELVKFNSLLRAHENVISQLIKVPTVQETLFSDYTQGVVKSLGAWGGDFVLVTVNDKLDLDYFIKKGYATIFSYNEMLLV